MSTGIFSQLAPTGSASLLNSMTFIQNPVEVCNQVFTLIENLTSQIRKRLEDPKSAGKHQNWKAVSFIVTSSELPNTTMVYVCL